MARFRSVRASLDSATSRNIAIQLVLQQCCKNKLHVFLLTVYPYLKIRTKHNRVQLREGMEHWVTPARAAAETTNSTPGERGGTPLYGLDGNVPLDRAWFFTSLSYGLLAGYIISCKSELNRVYNFV